MSRLHQGLSQGTCYFVASCALPGMSEINMTNCYIPPYLLKPLSAKIVYHPALLMERCKLSSVWILLLGYRQPCHHPACQCRSAVEDKMDAVSWWYPNMDHSSGPWCCITVLVQAGNRFTIATRHAARNEPFPVVNISEITDTFCFFVPIKSRGSLHLCFIPSTLHASILILG